MARPKKEEITTNSADNVAATTPETTGTSLPETTPIMASPVDPTPTRTETLAETKERLDKEKIEGLVRAVEELKKQNEMLLYVADKGRLQKWEDAHLGGKLKSVRLTAEEDGRVAISWRTIADRLLKNPQTNVVMGEYQEYEVTYHDNSTQKIIGYAAFVDWQYSKKIPAEVISETVERDGRKTFNVKLPDGRQLSINERFVN